MHRRQFLTATGAAALAGATSAPAREAIARKGRPIFRPALAAYSYKSEFGWMRGKALEVAGEPLTMKAFVDRCRDLEVGAELTSYFFPPDFGKADYLDLRNHAFVQGVPIVGTAIGNNFSKGSGPQLDRELAAAKDWIKRGAWMGAPHVRFFAGTAKDFAADPGRLAIAADAMKECCDVAAEHGIFLGVENHGNISPDQLLEIMERVDSPWIGINLDTGNFPTKDPYGDLARCAPFAVNVQVKVNMKTPGGEKYEADLDRIAQLLVDARYQGNVVLEYEQPDARDAVPAAMEKMRTALSKAQQG